MTHDEALRRAEQLLARAEQELQSSVASMTWEQMQTRVQFAQAVTALGTAYIRLAHELREGVRGRTA